MDKHTAPGRLGEEGGFSSLQFVLAAALAMVLVVAAVQLVSYQFIRGAALTAVERGVRAGSIVGAGPDECRQAMFDSLAGVLAGSAGQSIEADCEAEAGLITAWARGTLPGWAVGAPEMAFQATARAVREPAP